MKTTKINQPRQAQLVSGEFKRHTTPAGLLILTADDGTEYKIKRRQTFCKICKTVFWTNNKERHDSSASHENKVLRWAKSVLKTKTIQ